MTPPQCLFLDDERSPDDVVWAVYPPGTEFTIVRSSDEFKNQIRRARDGHRLFRDSSRARPFFDIISLDHDLQDFKEGKEVTGYDCLKWMLNKCPVLTMKDVRLIAHTKNPVGAKNINSLWKNYRKHWEI